MRLPRKALEVVATTNALTASILGVVVLPLVLLASPAYSYPTPQSQEEYDRYVQEADARIEQSRAVLESAQSNLIDALFAVDAAQAQLVESENLVAQTALNLSLAQVTYQSAVSELSTAQHNYDNNLIPDPNSPGEERVPGIRADIYNQLPTPNPLRADNLYNLCKTVTFTHINHQWGGGDIEGCGSDYVMIHYTGYLTIPESTPYGYDFLNNADDGWYMTLDGMVINENWVLKGCGGWWSQKFFLEAGRSYQLDAWYYEWGGGACSTLYYDNGYNWGVIPASWYSQNDYAETTYIHDPALLRILEQKQAVHDEASVALLNAEADYTSAQDGYNVAVALTEQTAQTKSEAEAAIPPLEEALQNALDMRDSIQPYIPYVEPEPEPTPEPEPSPEPSPEPTVEPTVEPTPPTEEEVMEELWAEATADDIVVSEELAAIPVLGSAIVALADAINFVGNVGADMSPEVREQSEKVVVSAVIVTQIATQAAATATMAAASASASASASSSGSSSAGRRK
jgi:outer membrane biosynthesis protein TonB